MKKNVLSASVVLAIIAVFLLCNPFANANTNKPIVAATSPEVAIAKDPVSEALAKIKNMNTTQMLFKEEHFDFGKIKKDVPASHTFVVTNTGTEPLVLANVKPGCGCTLADYTREPIMPNQTGKITATYNAKNVGKFTKNISVVANTTPSSISLTFAGEVVE